METEIQIAGIERRILEKNGAGAKELQLKDLSIERLELLDAQEKARQAVALDRLNATISELRREISASVLRAPFDGVVVDILTQNGYAVRPYEPILTLAKPGEHYVEYMGRDTFKCAPGDEVTAKIGHREIKLSYTSMPPTEQLAYIMEGLAVPVRLEFGAEDGAVLDVEPGLYADVRVLHGIATNVPAIPVNAIYGSPKTGQYVYVVTHDAEGELVKTLTPIKTGLTNLSFAEVTEGLSEGDIVYVKQ
jgi:multidrug efflux pump subunit AcrA (membrane-fusion protein)